ncbi:glycoside hydrolase family 3 N-terminal domain-containing protein [Propioniciclava soli]|uniref:glycoside hydrolase family 3 N-terminal domain-containing protein n=1 Tax=Propioniciclava soli TaxID=2775081 RepID=UPI001E50C047|nr:glycoside hydrolase family 3 N-terminal domain-containing protein [Propioniciclava soli]
MSETYLDAALPPEERAAALLPLVSLDEKMAQVSCLFPPDIADPAMIERVRPGGIGHVSALEARLVERLPDVAAAQRRLQTTIMDAGEHRIPAIFHMEGACGAYLPGATSFPVPIGRGAGFDPDLEEQIGRVVGRQERTLGITMTLAPVLDVAYDPRFGRHGESYGEDPALASALGAAYTRGVQDDDGSGRATYAVAKHFVSSHQVTGGIHGAHVETPTRNLIETYATPFQAAITLGGLRGVMPSYNLVDGTPMSASERLLNGLLRHDMGFTGLVVSDYGAVGQIHGLHRVGESPAAGGVLALRAGTDVEFHVPEAYADELKGWFATGRADAALLDRAVLRVLEAKFRMGLFEDPFAPEADVPERFDDADASAIALQSARQSLVLLRNDGVLPLTPSGARKVAVIGCHAASSRFFFGGYTHLSMAEGMFAANASMAGTVGETKQLQRTIPGTQIQPDDDPVFEDLVHRMYPGIRTLRNELEARLPNAEVAWAYGYPIAGPDDSGHAEALALAESADLVILTLGGKHGTSSIAAMGEGVDATDINLPPCQDALIEKLAALGKPLVGVHIDGRPISSDVADRHLNAIVEAWNPAEHGARAIVDLLLGETDPSGRLPVSVARTAGQVPVVYRHPRGSAWHQGGSIGFADYVDCPHTPRYPFGHGLTYTTFAYDDLRIEAAEVAPDDAVSVTVRLTNTGERAGTEVVQLYATDRFASLARPVLELIGFRRVTLEPGASTDVTFRFPVTQLAFLDADLRWVVEAGEIDLLVGASSEDIRLRGEVRIASDANVEGRDRGFFAATSEAQAVRERAASSSSAF